MVRAFFAVVLLGALVAAAPASLTPVAPRSEAGSGAETGVYAPPLAGPRAKISGTVQSDTAGPTGFYVVTFDSQGNQKYFHSTTDARGKYRFAIPAGVAAFMVFRHFDAQGHPDEGARCIVSGDPAQRVAGTRELLRASSHTPAITGGNSVFERSQPLTLQTRGVDGSAASVLVDGSAQNVDTLAASDRSIVAQVHPGTPLGRHELSVQSGSKRSEAVPADFIDATLTAGGSHETGGIQTAVLTVTGLPPGDRAIADFEVSGSAELARGGSQTSVPVVGDRASVDVRGTRAGPALIRWHLQVDIPPYWGQQVAESTPVPTATPYPYYTTSRPSPTPTHKMTATPTPKPPNNNDHTTSREYTPPPYGRRTPGPKTTTQPTPTPPPPTPTAYPTPSGSPSPTPTPCNYEIADGAFEPTQGVWQDDPFFPNMPGKQLTRLHDLDPTPHFLAELDMIEGRDTVLWGVNHYMDQGSRVDINSRHAITFVIMTNCTQTKAVRIAFTVSQRGQKKLIMNSQVFNVPLEGPRNADGTMKRFVLNLPLRTGIPAVPFTLDEGGYDITGTLVTMQGEDTGLSVIVTGDTVVTHPPTLHFVPMILFYGSTPPPPQPGAPIIGITQALRAESASMIPDYYPIAPFSLPTVRERSWFVSWEAIKNNDFWDATKFLTGYVLSGFDQDQADIFANLAVVERFTTSISNFQGFAAYINGANRMVIVMGQINYDTVMGSSSIASFNLGNKAVLMRAGVNADTVAHEVAHTIPPPNWNPDPTCELPYHNKGTTGVVPDPYGSGTTANGYAAGERLRLNGVRKRVFTDGTIHLMGGSVIVPTKRVYAYTTQCTYWHLKDGMLTPPDPPVFLVRGVLARRGSTYAALLGPTYSLMGAADLKSDARGSWHIALLDAGGKTLGTYGFTPVWNDENGKPRQAIPFAYRVPQLPGTAAIVLEGERRRLTLRMSPSPPVVRILAPTGSVRVGVNGAVNVRWQASVQTGYRPVSSVFVSDDGGKTYDAQVIESSGDHATVYVDPHKRRHRIQVIVSDYSRSSISSVDFKTP
ncbi:MAG TPA: hypothetical protein VFO29_03130 [Candidatus Rubrimentiphilum sp.]|nr:hypothetical protein [Candidatus Rubrimentiphilum sp.]